MAASDRVSIPFTFYFPSGTSPQLYASQSAGSYTSGTAINSLEPVVGTSVTVTDRNTLAAATIYQSETGTATYPSLTTNASGGISGWVDPGSYKIVAAALGSFVQTTINFEAVRGDGVTLIAPSAVTGQAIAPNAVDATKLATTVQQALVPVGTLLDFAGSAAPSGFLIANGQIVSTTTYSALAAIIGTTYNTGGEGAGNMRLPNFQQTVAVGVVNSTGGAPGVSSSMANALGLRGGQLDHNHTVPILSTTVNIPGLYIPSLTVNTPNHNHSLSSAGGAQIVGSDDFGFVPYFGDTGPNFQATRQWTAGTGTWAGSSRYGGSSALTGYTDVGGGGTGNTNASGTGGANSVGGSTTNTPQTTGAVNQQYLAVNKIIKY